MPLARRRECVADVENIIQQQSFFVCLVLMINYYKIKYRTRKKNVS